MKSLEPNSRGPSRGARRFGIDQPIHAAGEGEEIVEELQRLRAAMSAYRSLVERLLVLLMEEEHGETY